MFLLLVPLLLGDNDSRRELYEAHRYMGQGKYKEALKHFINFHETELSPDTDPVTYGLRLSIGLSSWKELGESYPPALKAMKKFRDRATQTLKNGDGNYSLFHDVVAMNQTLDENAKTFTLFERLEEDFPKEAKEYWILIEDMARDKGHTEIVRNFSGDLLERFAKARDTYRDGQDLDMEDADRFFGQDFNKLYFVASTVDLIQIAIEIGNIETAKKLQKKALEVVDDPRLHEALDDPSTLAQPDDAGNGENALEEERSP